MFGMWLICKPFQYYINLVGVYCTRELHGLYCDNNNNNNNNNNNTFVEHHSAVASEVLAEQVS